MVGAAGGIGRAICEDLTATGTRVALADLDNDLLVNLQASLEASGVEKPAIFEADITRQEAVATLLDQAVEHLGRLDAVINVVGLNVFGNLETLEEDDWDRIVRVNLKGPFLLGREATRVMRKSGQTYGSHIHFISGTSKFGSPGQGAYAACKAGLANLIKTMALEWARYGIRVNGISPIMTETAINRDWLHEDPDRLGHIASRIPLGRLGDPTDYTGVIRLLLSSGGRFITGQTLTVDGGTTVQHPLLQG